MLNMSAMNSRLMRSRIGTRLETRRSPNTVHGVIPALRPRFPSSEISVPSKLAIQGSWKTPVVENFDETLVPQIGLGLENVFGRVVSEDSCRLSGLPVMMLKGRPEPNSIRGANVQLLRSLLAKPSP